ncbi:MAG: peptidase S51 [Blastocatellia bacterium AA13]|nr:MAG: peptidase S51 [Blastocatellia bacterium AA13]
MKRIPFLLFLSLMTPIADAQIHGGPRKGILIIQGAGDIGRRLPRVWDDFIRLAGGPDANFVFIPTADNAVDLHNLPREEFPFDRLKHVTVLHTRCRPEADDEAFVAPLKNAAGVWFGSGRQFRLVDSYLHTRFQREVRAVLDRGGVVGGTSAGGVILASHLVHSAILDQKILIAKGYEEGFGYLTNLVIDQRIEVRKGEGDMAPIIASHPELLGLGLEESSAILVRGNILEVIGPGRVAITDGKDHGGTRYYFLSAGDRFDFKTRSKVAARPGR